MIPGVHSHDDDHDHAEHDMAVELGDGKVLRVRVNDVVEVKWESAAEDHDLQSLAGSDALSDCSFTGAEELVAPSRSGTFTLSTAEPTTYYLSCKTAGHCVAQQKLIVEVEPYSANMSAGSGCNAFVLLVLAAFTMVGIW